MSHKPKPIEDQVAGGTGDKNAIFAIEMSLTHMRAFVELGQETLCNVSTDDPEGMNSAIGKALSLLMVIEQQIECSEKAVASRNLQ